MPNQYKNKVIYGDQTLMDITDTTASSEDVLEGEVFYSANGARSVGTLGDATTSTHGLMSAADKTKLDGLDLLGVKLNTTTLTPDVNGYVSIPLMTGATSSADGAAGLVPAPSAGDEDKILKGNGTWVALPDTSIFATKANPIFTNSISLSRSTNSIIGINSIAVGDNVVATGTASIATGASTEAHGLISYAGGYSSIAGGQCSHVEGIGLVAPFANQFIIGLYNYYGNTPNWVAGTSYNEGDDVLYNNTYYWCIESNSDSEWNAEKWEHGSLGNIFTIGYGQSDSLRANILNVDTSGTLYLRGNVYVGCNYHSTGGNILATQAYVNTALGNISTMTGATSSANGTSGLVPAPTTTDVDKFLAGDGTYKSGGLPMVILSYGHSTWQDFIDAYNNNVIVYARASSNSNPASGSQTRMAFMAYVNNATTPTEVEFQYYRSMNAHSATAMGDQVFVYKLNKNNGWSVITRDASIKQIKVDTNDPGTVSWSGNVVTLKSGLPKVTSADEGKILKVVDGVWTAVDP